DRVEAQVLATVGLSAGPAPAVLRVSSRTGAGLRELWDTVAALPVRRSRQHDEASLLCHAQELLATRFAAARGSGANELARLLAHWQSGEIEPDQAAAALLMLLGKSNREGEAPAEPGDGPGSA